MKIKELEDGYRKIKFEKDLDNFMTDKAADDIIEIFNTPLTGTYNWGLYSPRQSNKETL